MLDCDEFLNADEIARGLSPFKPENVAIQAGRLMLAKIHDLLKSGQDFAFVDQWMFIDNSGDSYEGIAERYSSANKILNGEKWVILKENYSK